MSNIKLKMPPAELAPLKPFLEKNDFSGAYKLIKQLPSPTPEFTELFLQCGIDPLDYMDEVPNDYAREIKHYQFSLPNHIKKVGDSSFSLTKVYTANLENVEIVLPYAFSYCTYLNTIHIGNNLKIIPYSCFCFCTSLKKVELPANIEVVGVLAFGHCKNLSHVIIHNPKCELNTYKVNSSFMDCPKDMLVEVRSKKLANEFKKARFTNVKIF